MIHIRSMAFGTFVEIEPLNPAFRPRQAKMRVTVDTERRPRLPESDVLSELTGAFPGLARHQCRAGAGEGAAASAGTRILLVPRDASANQAHIFEHLTLEFLGAIDESANRLSGVTCAYTDPPERNDVFVECRDPDDAALAAWLAAEVMNGLLSGHPAAPLYPDVLHVARLMHDEPPAGVDAAPSHPHRRGGPERTLHRRAMTEAGRRDRSRRPFRPVGRHRQEYPPIRATGMVEASRGPRTS